MTTSHVVRWLQPGPVDVLRWDLEVWYLNAAGWEPPVSISDSVACAETYEIPCWEATITTVPFSPIYQMRVLAVGTDNVTVSPWSNTVVVPEAGALPMLMIGLLTIAVLGRRRWWKY
jgi:hypothetical protein